MLAVDNPNRALGIVCDSLVDGDKTEELGFIGAASVETLFELVAYHGLYIREINMSKAGVVVS